MSHILCLFEEFGAVFKPSWTGHSGFGPKPKHKLNQPNNIAENMFFLPNYVYTNMWDIKKHVLKWENAKVADSR